MGVFDFVKNGVREMMVARPDNAQSAHRLQAPRPERPDVLAAHRRQRRVRGLLQGRARRRRRSRRGGCTLQTQNIPFLNHLVTSFTGGQVFIAEIFFVKTAPVRSVPFGGPIGDMLDPLTGEQVQPRIFGEMSVVVVDPVRFIVGYSGQAAAGDNDSVLELDQGPLHERREDDAGRALRERGQEPAPGRVAHEQARGGLRRARAGPQRHRRADPPGRASSTSTSARRTAQRLVAANAEIAKAQREVRVKQIGVAGAAADAQARQFELDQKFGQDARYVKELAGSYQGYAAGQAVMGAGQGMAEHGVGGGIAGMGAQMAVGMGMGNAMAGRAFAPQPPPAPPPAPDVLARGHAGDVRQVRRRSSRVESSAPSAGHPLVVAEEVLQRLRRRARAPARSSARAAERRAAAAPPAG